MCLGQHLLGVQATQTAGWAADCAVGPKGTPHSWYHCAACVALPV